MNFATPSPADFYRVMPELIWCGFGALLMLLQSLTKNRPALATVAFIGAAAGTATSIFAMRYPGPGFFGLIQQDTFSFFFHLLLGSVAALVILATAGMGVLASAQELLTAFIGLEMSSIASYVLAGYRRDTLKSSESSL